VKAVVPTSSAEADIDHAIDFYLSEASLEVAERFLAAYDKALLHISRFPDTGSRRYASAGKPDELRFWTLDRFPYAVFYVERNSLIEVVRVLHQASDIPSHLDE